MKAAGVSIRGRIKEKSKRWNLMADVTLILTYYPFELQRCPPCRTSLKLCTSIYKQLFYYQCQLEPTCMWSLHVGNRADAHVANSWMNVEDGICGCGGRIWIVRLTHHQLLCRWPSLRPGEILQLKMIDPYKMQSFHQLLRICWGGG